MWGIGRRAVVTGVVVVALTLAASSVAAAASNHSATRHEAKALSKSAAAKRYLALANPLNFSASVFGGELSQANATTTAAEVEVAAAPLIARLKAMKKGLLTERWPAPVDLESKSLAQFVGKLEADISQLGSLALRNAQDVSAWGKRYFTDAFDAATLTTFIRRNLGLPYKSVIADSSF